MLSAAGLRPGQYALTPPTEDQPAKEPVIGPRAPGAEIGVIVCNFKKIVTDDGNTLTWPAAVSLGHDQPVKEELAEQGLGIV